MRVEYIEEAFSEVEEKISSRAVERGALREAFDKCRDGDVLVVAAAP